mmetsp:Transcript_18556/g.33527  ORF Transcript_18556/g.33527 Transcript_18556/m.33527 type:complete len:119 (+) Transcript_18556:84-440(+)
MIAHEEPEAHCYFELSSFKTTLSKASSLLRNYEVNLLMNGASYSFIAVRANFGVEILRSHKTNTGSLLFIAWKKDLISRNTPLFEELFQSLKALWERVIKQTADPIKSIWSCMIHCKT